MDIKGYLEAKVKLSKVPVPVDIEGSFQINYNDDEITHNNDTSIEVRLIFICERNLSIILNQIKFNILSFN